MRTTKLVELYDQIEPILTSSQIEISYVWELIDFSKNLIKDPIYKHPQPGNVVKAITREFYEELD